MAELKIDNRSGTLRIQLSGRLDLKSIAEMWQRLATAFEEGEFERSELHADRLEYLDGAGATLLTSLRRDHGLDIQGLAPELETMLAVYDVAKITPPKPPAERSVVESVGRGLLGVFEDLGRQIAFFGELLVVTLGVARQPRTFRWRDSLRVAERAGVNALPIIGLIGFLLGLVLSFQSAMMMRQFAAEVFVADLIGISMVRELGPLMTAIVLAGRSGSAFAAELGTMTVREEIDALETMALDPVRFLVVPRLVAIVGMTPFLVLFCNFAAFTGGAIVLVSLDYPLVTFLDRVTNQVTLATYFIGLLKSVVFAMIVAAVGCFRGLGTSRGAASVGQSTTSSVVTSIVLIAVADATFSIVFYVLGV